VVAEFLLQTGRGPDYLFASSSAVLLRSLGYPTRIVSGLYAAADRYDAVTRHTPVTRDDVHFWAEVRMPDGVWVAVEPTPGYELMPPVRPWSERIARVLATAGQWIHGHMAELVVGAVVLVLLVVRRRELLDRLATLALRLTPTLDPRRRVLRTLSLLEWRARWAGGPRPAGLTLARWYQPVARLAAGEAGVVLEKLVGLADWAVHSPERPGWPSPMNDTEIERACTLAARDWTLARFRAVFLPRSRKVATTCGR
jgi:hypothetical protein